MLKAVNRASASGVSNGPPTWRDVFQNSPEDPPMNKLPAALIVAVFGTTGAIAADAKAAAAPAAKPAASAEAKAAKPAKPMKKATKSKKAKPAAAPTK